MADSKVDLGAGAPGGYSFGIAGYGVRPRVFVEGRQTGRTPSVALPEGDVLLDISNQSYYGKIGVDVTSPGGDTFGGGASGSYYRGSVDYPEELQRYGAPDRETYSARGIQSPEYSGYYQTKDGPRFEGYYRDMPEGSGMPDEYGGRVSYTIPFENGGEVGYYPEGPPSKVDLGAGAAKVEEDIADLGPYLEGNYLAQLGLESLSPDRIFELKGKYNTAGFYSPQDASARRLSKSDRFALREMIAQGRDPSALFDPSLRGVVSNPLKAYLSYSYPDASSGDMYVEPFDTKIGSRFSRPGEEFPRPKEEEYLDRDLTEEESRRQALATLVHELTHAGDVALTRTLQADDEPYNAGRGLGENYARLIDIMNRDRGLGTLQSKLGREYEGRAVSEGIGSRYIGDPFETSVRKDGFFNARERLDPEAFEKAVLSIPAQDAARRELLRRMAERTPTGGYEYGGEVEKPMGIENSVTITQSIPANDPRSVALGSRLLKQAGFAGDFRSVLKNADPRVVEQVNRIMARGPANEISSPSNGLGVFVQSVMQQS
jgi:hypothetical protein